MHGAKKSIKTTAVLICLISLLVFAKYHFSDDLNAIKPGEQIGEFSSPSGTYTITAYLNNGGATTDYAVLCVLSDGTRKKNIYWNYHCYSAEIVWVDDDTVIINGIRLENILEDTYDFRKQQE